MVYFGYYTLNGACWMPYLDADVLGGLQVGARRADELATDDVQQQR